MKKPLCYLLVLAITSSGCSAFRSSTQMVSITTDQPDSQIYVNGILAGQGTANASVKRNQNVQVMAKKSGYVTIQRTIGHSLNTTGVLDIIGGVLILLPLFGLLASGSHSLDENNLTIAMVKE